MNKKRNYAGIDWFRLFAAFLIVAIHTSPLASFSETGDFILTRIAARTAVPFFLMTSGFFLISKYGANADRLRTFVRNTAVIYGIAILFYIPINIYNGYFGMENLLPNILRDLVFDGTMYHLWYLPAAMSGAVIAWYAVKRCGFYRALGVTAALYLIGLFGDSYFGLAEMAPAVKGFYGLVFQIADYTRNGLFFAPIFFVLGGMLANRRALPLKKNIVGFAVSFVFLFGEAMLLRHYKLQRHDSMYVFLPICMYFLFGALSYWRGGRRKRRLRSLSLIVYIVHPMMIVAVRMAAKLLGWERLLIDNSLVHYFAVSALSAALAFGADALLGRLKKNGGESSQKRRNAYGPRGERAWIERNFANLRHNAKALKNAMPAGCELMAVVKADAYGHGAPETAAFLEQNGVNAFAVATIEEGIELRKYGISGEILILGYTNPYRAGELKRYNLIQTIIDLAYARQLERQKAAVRAHIKIDTGMHRLGIDAGETGSVEKVFFMEHIKVCGIYTHLCCADSLKEEDVRFTRAQIGRFERLLDRLKQDGLEVGKVHIQSSYGLLNYPELQCDYVRAGIALYGVSGSPSDDRKLSIELRPVLSLKSRVVLIRAIKKGECVGYARRFTAERDSVIAVLPIGYCDGVPRSLSDGKGYVEIRGQMVLMIGRVCMDLVAVDVTDIEDVAVGDVATLISNDAGSLLCAPSAAERSGSIANELLCRLGARLKA